MLFLEPAVRLVGRLSFRNKLRATALVFGLPLLLALVVILSGLGTRVSALNFERDALAVQTPALSFLANIHQYLAVRQAVLEGAELNELAQTRRQAAESAFNTLESVVAERTRLSGSLTDNKDWLASIKTALQQVESTERDELGELHSRLKATLRVELEKLNERAGLLVDGETSSSRLIDILTAQLPDLIDNTGQAARLGGVVLATKRFKSSRRTELTVLRGNFNALVQWSMDGLEKVVRERPELASHLDGASSLFNTAYLGIQEAITTKMLDTSDFDMVPEEYLALNAVALDQSLTIASILQNDADTLLAERLAFLEAQRNGVIAAIVLILALVIAGFIAAYISIMRGLNSLSNAVNTMASGDLGARVAITTSDEIGAVGTQFNLMVESLAQRTALLREKTNDIHTMLQNMPQGILTMVKGGTIHHEYSSYLETIFETGNVAGQSAIELIFCEGSVGADVLSQIEVTISSCIGEDRMNFEFNGHLLVGEVNKTMPDGRVKCLELSWSPICDENDTVEKIMVCVRDVSELRKLEAEAEQQKRELQMIGQILSVNQEKFHEFVDSSRNFIVENEALLMEADDRHPELVTQLFRNMHTIKGNARTYGLLHLTNVVHEAEQAYDDLRKNSDMKFQKQALLDQLQDVMNSIEEYASLNEVKLGRKGPGRRGNTEKYFMVQRTQVEKIISDLDTVDRQAFQSEAQADALRRVKLGLLLIGTDSIRNILDAVFQSLPSLARELDKEPPVLQVNDNGIFIRNQLADLLRNVFMHLYRNSMDHGIERAAERAAKGKPPVGTIRLDMSMLDEKLVLRMKDDGKGLALGYIRNKGIEKNLVSDGLALTDEEIAQLIFAPGFSTAAAVTEVSGRGVGMDAVQDFIKREEGSLQIILTDSKVGADFRSFETLITLPGKFAVNTCPASSQTPEDKQIPEAISELPEHVPAHSLRSTETGVFIPRHLVTV